ncbi:uncharacterized protein DS421_9g266150 [Arachis hypogaea]|nr:uncharacterized protein DS421_9g266150 [Arachis hypogaea]
MMTSQSYQQLPNTFNDQNLNSTTHHHHYQLWDYDNNNDGPASLPSISCWENSEPCEEEPFTSLNSEFSCSLISDADEQQFPLLYNH